MLSLINSNTNLNSLPASYTTGEYGFKFQSFDSSISLLFDSLVFNKITLNSRILKLLEEYALLQDNWDEDEALAPIKVVIDNAKYLTNLLEKHGQPIYHVAPGPNGELMLDIRNRAKKRSIEIIIYKNKSIVVTFPEDGRPVQSEFNHDLLPHLLSWLNNK